MTKTIIATILSLGLGFGAGYAYMNHTNNVIIEEQNKKIKQLKIDLGDALIDKQWYVDRNKDLIEENSRLFQDRNAGVIFGIQLCKKMKDTRACLLELGVKTRSPMDFHDE